MTGSTLLLDPLRVLIFILAQLLIAVTNSRLMKRLTRYPASLRHPRVSILVPARNEAGSIEACVRSLLAQDYEDFEVIVLDDHSEDATREGLTRCADPRLRVIAGKNLPDGWLGKNWACHQLAELTSAELLLFTDADTVHAPGTLRAAVNALESEEADLVTALVKVQTRTPGELLTVPFPPWSMVTLLPLSIAYALPRSPAFTAANGMFLLFRRAAYTAVGGHAAVRDDAVEDVALSRRVKRLGLRWRLLDATDLVSSRMYSGFRAAVTGFTRNYFALFGYRILIALFVWAWLLAVTWWPLVTGAVLLAAGHPEPNLYYSVAAIAATALLWRLAARKTGYPGILALLYPAVITISAGIGLRSMVLTILGRARWKGRRLAPPRIRLL